MGNGIWLHGLRKHTAVVQWRRHTALSRCGSKMHNHIPPLLVFPSTVGWAGHIGHLGEF